MTVTHVEPWFDGGDAGESWLVLHVRGLPRTGRDWEDAAAGIALVVVPLFGDTLAFTVARHEPGSASRWRVGPLPAVGDRARLAGLPAPDHAPRVLAIDVRPTYDEPALLPAAIRIAPLSAEAAGDRQHDLVGGLTCVVRVAPAPRTAFARSRKVSERAAAAADPGTPPDVLEQLAGDASATVRRAVAANPETPAGSLAALAVDPKRPVREAVVANPTLAPAVLLRLLDDEAWQVRLCVTDHPNADDTVIRAAAAHPDVSVRTGTAARSRPPADVTALLLADDHHEVRSVLASHTSDAAALAALVADADPRVRVAGTNNPNLTPEQVDALSRDRREFVRYWVATGRRDLTLEQRERLARDRSWYVRDAMAHVPQPPSVLAILAEDPVEGVRSAALRHGGPW